MKNNIEVKPVITKHERRVFLTFPWKIYEGDPLWVPPLLSERAKTIDPQKGKFFQDGYADLFIAWQDGKPVGTIAYGEDQSATQNRGSGECLVGFFECVQDYSVAEALFKRAEDWAWSSAGAHCGRRTDILLSPLPPHAPVQPEQWSAWLRSEQEQAVQTIRLCTRTGRPAGDKDFVAHLEKRLGRPLAAKPVGRPKKDNQGHDDEPK